LNRRAGIGWLAGLLLTGSVAMGQTAPAPAAGDTVQVGQSTLVGTGDSLAVDTTRLTPVQNARIRKINPRSATMRSLVLPGLGQAYNRQYWKIPLVYGGFGVFGYLVSFYNRQYLFYRKYGIEANLKPGRETMVPGFNYPITAARLERAASSSRRYRDLNVLLTAAFWALNIVDANVTAHLKTFDLSDDLSLQVKPDLLPAGTPVRSAALAPGLRLAFTWKK